MKISFSWCLPDFISTQKPFLIKKKKCYYQPLCKKYCKTITAKDLHSLNLDQKEEKKKDKTKNKGSFLGSTAFSDSKLWIYISSRIRSKIYFNIWKSLIYISKVSFKKPKKPIYANKERKDY